MREGARGWEGAGEGAIGGGKGEGGRGRGTESIPGLGVSAVWWRWDVSRGVLLVAGPMDE